MIKASAPPEVDGSPPPQLSEAAYRELAMALGARYWHIADPVYIGADGNLLIEPTVRDEVETQLRVRYEEFYTVQVPWIERVKPLGGARVLEIGAGTGAWTVALCQHGAVVDGIDIDTRALEVARKRCQLYDVATDSVRFSDMNATQIDRLPDTYDVVLFCASYEHMTHTERKDALRKAWDKLRPGGLLGLLECPNRLWYDDRHTTFMNFFNWLPDDLAIDYARYCDRPDFVDALAGQGQDSAALRLARWGRGVSYHDLEVVLGPVDQLNVKEGLDDHKRRSSRDYQAWWIDSPEARYRDFLRNLQPKVPSAFFYPWLHILIQKDA